MQRFFQNFIDRLAGATDTAPDDEEVRIATALLLVEIGQADHQWQESEIEAIVERLARRFDLDRETAATLLEEARQRDTEQISLHPTLQVINAHFTPRQKQQIVTDCWRVALADGVLDHHEEHQIRRIADLLHLPHSAFIQAKLQAEAERDGEAG